MISKDRTLSLSRKCQILNVSRGSFYYDAVELGFKYKDIIAAIDEIHLEFPWFGQRGIRDQLKILRGITVSRFLVKRLMQHMRIRALYQEPKTTVPGKGKQHKTSPDLLKGLVSIKANQVWSTDITYIRMGEGFMYLTAIIDWYTRKILSWRLSNTMEVDFCLECLDEAVARYGTPEIFNTDQGAQYTCKAFRKKIIDEYDIKLSMDGKGRWADNIIIERFWRSIKYEEVYRRAYENGREARQGIGNYILLYNSRRSHSSIGKRTPESLYFEQLPHLQRRLPLTG